MSGWAMLPPAEYKNRLTGLVIVGIGTSVITTGEKQLQTGMNILMNLQMLLFAGIVQSTQIEQEIKSQIHYNQKGKIKKKFTP